MKKINLLVGAIPVCNNEILVTQRSNSERFLPGVWGVPCGKVNYGENLETAVLRELKEETGLDGKIRKQVGYSEFFSRQGKLNLYNLQVNFLVEVNKAKPVYLDKSAQSYKWISAKKTLSSGLDTFTISTIKQAIEI